MRVALAIVCVATLASVARADNEDFSNTMVVFVRGDSLIKADGRGRDETPIAKLPSKTPVRALRTDARGKSLLADLGGTWWWMPLDGSTATLTELPCATGPAQLSLDGRYVLCRAKTGNGSLVVNLVSGKLTALPVPTLGARLLGTAGSHRQLVWADKGQIWSALAPRLAKPVVVAKEAPLRSFLPSPDGKQAVGVYSSVVYESPRVKKVADVLMVFRLDGEGARRKTIQNGVPVDWSFDSKWVLVQDGSSACVMLAAGGQYKCWRGYTAASISEDGRYALLLGNRGSHAESEKKPDSSRKKDAEGPDNGPAPEDEGDELGGTPMPIDDVAVPPPTGPRSLYRATIAGAFTKPPALIGRDVEGAAVWVPRAQ